jgi:hypothetical protein
LPTVTVYYHYCPDCNQKWAEHLSQANVIRVGREKFVCKCNKEWNTGNVEWAHLDKKQRKSYLLSSAEIGVILICTLVPPVFGYFTGPGWRAALEAGAWGFAVGFAFACILWMIKAVLIMVSLRRCPEAPNPFNQSVG